MRTALANKRARFFFGQMSNTDRIIQGLHSELSIEFVRASGPGGQNVNKVSTAAQLRFNIGASAVLPEDAKTRLMRLAGKRVTGEGMLLIEARRYRTQDRNRADAVARFDDLLRRALQPAKQRLPTKATAASQLKRLQSKKRKAEIKKSRRAQPYDV